MSVPENNEKLSFVCEILFNCDNNRSHHNWDYNQVSHDSFYHIMLNAEPE